MITGAYPSPSILYTSGLLNVPRVRLQKAFIFSLAVSGISSPVAQ
jgi:hypothetical protein